MSGSAPERRTLSNRGAILAFAANMAVFLAIHQRMIAVDYGRSMKLLWWTIPWHHSWNFRSNWGSSILDVVAPITCYLAMQSVGWFLLLGARRRGLIEGNIAVGLVAIAAVGFTTGQPMGHFIWRQGEGYFSCLTPLACFASTALLSACGFRIGASDPDSPGRLRFQFSIATLILLTTLVGVTLRLGASSTQEFAESVQWTTENLAIALGLLVPTVGAALCFGLPGTLHSNRIGEKVFGIVCVALSLVSILGFALDLNPTSDHKVVPMYVSIAAIIPIGIALTFRGRGWCAAMSIVSLVALSAADLIDARAILVPYFLQTHLLAWLYNVGAALVVSQLVAIPWLIAGIQSYAVPPVWVRRRASASDGMDTQ
jgi:hypothetical protein